ncbi:hypothetical protein BE221DRAFT_74315 [Ostreococcus tauri]|uniref:Uncharacterized protein n=1 Tax=Ostreococcus tauri TaxID=70448 RepID=A0A1Y5IAI0_OSTTA|nr:hypothetical protein BE221DRAFT_74315 [Ostreococcus tauri]
MRDPFTRADAWRAHPLLNTPWSKALPGFGLGLAAFLAYVAVEKTASRRPRAT